MKAAQQAQLRQGVAAAPGPLNTAQSQQLGAQARAQAGQTDLAAAEQTQKQTAQMGNMGLAEQAQTNQAALAGRRLGIQQKRRDLENKLAALSENIKTQLLDNTIAFQQDELGRTQWNERQLLDWKLRQAKDTNDLYNYRQQVQQVSSRKMQALKTAHARIKDALANDAAKNNQELDQASRERMARAKVELERKMQEAANDAANRAAMFGALGGAVGGAAGAAIFKTPQGAQAGASIGSSTGTLASATGLGK
jgi:hypothetical protein